MDRSVGLDSGTYPGLSDDRKVCSLLTKLEKAVEGGKTLEQLTESLDYFSYYQEAYEAVLGAEWWVNMRWRKQKRGTREGK